MRTGAGISYRVVTVLAKGARIETTGVDSNGYSQIVADGQIRWVSSQYLSGKAAPAPTPAGPGLPPVVGTATATAELMIRTSPDEVFQSIRDVPVGTVLQLTGRTRNGRTEVINGIIELHRRLARGYSNRNNYRLHMLLAASGLSP